MSNSSWAPDEDAATIFAEDMWMQGALLMCIAYGSTATLCIQCFAMLAPKVPRRLSLKLSRDVLLLGYVILIFALSTVLVGGTMKFTQQAFVDDRNYPGGPSAYETAPVPLDALINDCITVSTFLSDALLLWRCTVIYKNSSVPDWVSNGISVALWLTEIVLGILFILHLSPNSSSGNIDFTLVFWSFSLAVNILVTLAIVGRILLYRYRLMSVFGKKHVSDYTGVIAMVVESELLYTAFLILFIVPFGLHNLLTAVFIESLSLVQAIAALMIVYRVAQGKAWMTDTHAQMSNLSVQRSTLQFSDVSTSRIGASTILIDDGRNIGVRSEKGESPIPV